MNLPRGLDHNILKIALKSAVSTQDLGKHHAIEWAVTHVRTRYRLSLLEMGRLRHWLKTCLESGLKPQDFISILGSVEDSGKQAESQHPLKISQDRLKYFRRPIESHGSLPIILGWLGFFSFLFIFNKTIASYFSRYGDVFWWALLLLFIPGITLGSAINYSRVKVQQWLRKRQPDYKAFLRYEEANKAESERKLAAENAAFREKMERKQAEERQKREEVSWWKRLDGPQFERELTKLLQRFQYNAERRGGSGDGGVDIEITEERKKIIVQCKAQRNYVSPGAVRELYGTLMHEDADEAWLITTHGFYSGSRAFAAGKPIRLYTIEQVLKGALNERDT